MKVPSPVPLLFLLLGAADAASPQPPPKEGNVLVVKGQEARACYRSEAAGLSATHGGFVTLWSCREDGGGETVEAQVLAGDGTTVGQRQTVGAAVSDRIGVSKAGSGFVAAWEDKATSTAHLRLYTGNGQPSGPAFPADPTPGAVARAPSVAGLQGGGFVAVWMTSSGARGQVFDAAGAPQAGGGFEVVPPGTARIATVAALENGGFVAVWGIGSHIEGRLFDAQGVAAGVPFRVSSTVASNQQGARAAGLSGGGFVVVWRNIGQDGDGWGVYGQRFTAAGVKQGVEFAVNTIVEGDQAVPRVTSTVDGGFAVVWESYESSIPRIYVALQSFDAAGGRHGTEVQVQARARPGSVAGLQGGGFAVVWRTVTNAAINAQRYGAPLLDTPEPPPPTPSPPAVGTPWFSINTHRAGNQLRPVAAPLVDGGFVVAWTSSQQDGQYGGIYMQRYSRAWVPVGPETQVNQQWAGDQTFGYAAGLSNGGFVVAWMSSLSQSRREARAQVFDAAGQRVGEEFTAGQYSTSSPVTAGMLGGGFVVATTRGTELFGAASGPLPQPSDFPMPLRAVAPVPGAGFIAAATRSTDGTPVAALFLPNGARDGPVLEAVPAPPSSGRRIVQSVWAGSLAGSAGHVLAWIENDSVHVQRFDAQLQRAGAEAVLDGAGRPQDVRVAPLRDGRYSVVWWTFGSSQPYPLRVVYSRTGDLLTGPDAVTQGTRGQFCTGAAVSHSASALVYTSDANDGTLRNIAGRRYDTDAHAAVRVRLTTGTGGHAPGDAAVFSVSLQYTDNGGSLDLGTVAGGADGAEVQAAGDGGEFRPATGAVRLVVAGAGTVADGWHVAQAEVDVGRGWERWAVAGSAGKTLGSWVKLGGDGSWPAAAVWESPRSAHDALWAAGLQVRVTTGTERWGDSANMHDVYLRLNDGSEVFAARIPGGSLGAVQRVGVDSPVEENLLQAIIVRPQESDDSWNLQQLEVVDAATGTWKRWVLEGSGGTAHGSLINYYGKQGWPKFLSFVRA